MPPQLPLRISIPTSVTTNTALVTPVRQENEQERRHRLDRDNDLQREHWLGEQRQRELGEERGRDGDDIDDGY